MQQNLALLKNIFFQLDFNPKNTFFIMFFYIAFLND